MDVNTTSEQPKVKTPRAMREKKPKESSTSLPLAMKASKNIISSSPNVTFSASALAPAKVPWRKQVHIRRTVLNCSLS